MSTAIGRISAILSASAAKFSSGIKSAQTSLKGLGRTASSIKGVVGSAGKGIASSFASVGSSAALGLIAGTTGAAAGLTLLVKTQMESIDSLAKTADSIGITTEALGGLRHAANLAGVDGETFDKSLTKLVRTTAEAAAGSEGARDTFRDLGLSYTNLAKLAPDQQLKAVADALAKIPAQGERVRLATELFGREGAKLVNVLNGGSAALSEAQAEADKLGLTFSRIDAAQVELANDSITKLWGLVQGVGNTLAIELSPYITEASNRFLGMATAGGGLKTIVGPAIGWTIMGIAYLADGLDYARMGWEVFKGVGNGALIALMRPLEWLTQGIAKLADWFSDYLPQSVVEGARDVSTFFEKFNQETANEIKEGGKKIQDIWNGPSTSDKVSRFLREARENSKEQAEEIAKQAPAQKDYNAELFKTLELQDFERKKDKEKKDTKKKDQEELRLAELLSSDSGEAQKAFYDAFLLNRSAPVEEEQLREQRKMVDLLIDINDKTGADDLVPVIV